MLFLWFADVAPEEKPTLFPKFNNALDSPPPSLLQHRLWEIRHAYPHVELKLMHMYIFHVRRI